MDELLASIANIGFPIVISCYLLTRIEGKMTELSACINELSKTIEKNVN
ncbi:YvrJ family protein [Peptoniphilus obesi]|nr:YvrJ family protein [Peptoniphilus obesi]